VKEKNRQSQDELNAMKWLEDTSKFLCLKKDKNGKITEQPTVV